MLCSLPRDEYLETIRHFSEEEGLVIKYSGVKIAVFPSKTPHTCWQDFIFATNEVEDYDCEDMVNMRRLEDKIRKRLDWSLVSGEVDKHTQIYYVFILFKVHTILWDFEMDKLWLRYFNIKCPSNQKSIYQSFLQFKDCKRENKKYEECGLLNWGEVYGYGVIDEDDSDDEDWDGED
jgi:hypothetical protein